MPPSDFSSKRFFCEDKAQLSKNENYDDLICENVASIWLETC